MNKLYIESKIDGVKEVLLNDHKICHEKKIEDQIVSNVKNNFDLIKK